jgi:hypothetical protein
MFLPHVAAKSNFAELHIRVMLQNFLGHPAHLGLESANPPAFYATETAQAAF